MAQPPPRFANARALGGTPDEAPGVANRVKSCCRAVIELIGILDPAICVGGGEKSATGDIANGGNGGGAATITVGGAVGFVGASASAARS